jgi:hypothetical protein
VGVDYADFRQRSGRFMAWLVRSGHISAYVATLGIAKSRLIHLHVLAIGPGYLPQPLLLQRARALGLGSGHVAASSRPSRHELDVRSLNSAERSYVAVYAAQNALDFAQYARSNLTLTRIRPITRGGIRP